MSSEGFREVNLPCPYEDCGSSDAYAIDNKGLGYCFSCKRVHREDAEELETEFLYSFFPHRGLNEKTLRKYDIVTKLDLNNNPIETGFKYPEYTQVRSHQIPKKEKGHFKSTGSIKKAGLFGMDKFPEGGDVCIITEGAYDAAASYQMSGIPSFAIVSSSSARTQMQNSWEELNKWKKIILAFDSDIQGQEAVKNCAGLFDFHKVYHAKFIKYKDANDYLENSAGQDFVDTISQAKKFVPDNIINTFEDMAKALEENHGEKIGEYPFEGLQGALLGLHREEVVVFKGTEGIGKTEVFRALQDHLLKTEENAKLGIIHLEESKKTTIKGIANYAENYPYLHLDDNSPNEEVLEAVKKLLKTEDRVHIYENFDIEDETLLFDTIRFLVSTCGVNFVFLDHITWLATGKEEEDERRKLDRISQNFKLLAKELKCCVIMISHTNDDGKTRGSRNITKVSNTVIDMNREKTHALLDERLKTHFFVEKSRGGGTKDGYAGYALYNPETLVLGNPETDFNLGDE